MYLHFKCHPFSQFHPLPSPFFYEDAPCCAPNVSPARTTRGNRILLRTSLYCTALLNRDRGPRGRKRHCLYMLRRLVLLPDWCKPQCPICMLQERAVTCLAHANCVLRGGQQLCPVDSLTGNRPHVGRGMGSY